MSWFGTDTIVQDSRPNEAVAEGVLLERRSVLRLSARSAQPAVRFVRSRRGCVICEFL